MTDPLGLIGNAAGPQGVSAKANRAADSAAAGGPNFKDVLLKNIEEVNRLQAEAEQAAQDLLVGRRDDLSGVMIAQKKAETAFKALMQVRTKLMEAYDEVKQLRV
jgi:flagellar hook-basal body complex protein FliE